MGVALLRVIACLPATWAVLWASVEAGEKVALRTGSGRFLRASDDGAVRAEQLFPAEQETFELVSSRDDHLALQAYNGRLLWAEGRDARTLRADSPRIEPDDRETFVPVPVDGNRVGMKARNYRDLIVFDRRSPKPGDANQPQEPAPAETVEIYRVSQVPSAVRSGLATAIRALVIKELADEEYDKRKTRKIVKYIELPAPTLRDPRRKKKHRLLSTAEEYHIKARLDGPPEIDIAEMPYLQGYQEPGVGVLMFVVRASLPVRGWVRYEIPKAVSASTGFRTVVGLSMVGEVRAERSDDELSLNPPEVIQINVELDRLDISNDLLNVARRQIEELINREIRRKKDRILQQANKSLRNAVEARKFRHPLLRYLGFP